MIDGARFARVKDRFERMVVLWDDMEFLIRELEIIVYKQVKTKQRNHNAYMKRRDKHIASVKKYREANKEQIRARLRQPEVRVQNNDHQRVYYEKHREEILERSRQRRKAKREATHGKD